MKLQERYKRLKHYLSEENPILLEVTQKYESIDKIGHKTGLLEVEDSYTSDISWWPLISILGTFSAGKSTFINNYVDDRVQVSGNQAVDDKFTAICYGHNDTVTTLPGMALDADPRFPFYNISDEVNKVDAGEGNRVNLYLQLKTVKSDALKGKILVDSPGFDADSQRDSILRITSHMIDMSDLVLIFFDARHPEPGAMRDTLDHLVKSAMQHADADKVLYILNQIDTTAKEDNLEDVIGAWQRAMAQKGLVAGHFYTIYNESSATPIDDPALRERLKKKKDHDLGTILNRMDKVSTERSYRIVRTLEDISKDLKDEKLPLVHDALKSWSKKVLLTDAVLFGLIFIAIAVLQIKFDILTMSTLSMGISGFMAVIFGLYLHLSIRKIMTHFVAKKWENRDPNIARSIRHNTRWWKSLLGPLFKSWGKQNKRKLEILIEQSKLTIQELNDQFINPSGVKSPETKVEDS